MKTITGLLNPTSGEIYFEGHKWTRADLADIGALIETPPIYEKPDGVGEHESARASSRNSG